MYIIQILNSFLNFAFCPTLDRQYLSIFYSQMQAAVTTYRGKGSRYIQVHATNRSASKVCKRFCISEKTVRDIWKARTWAKETGHLDSSMSVVIKKMGRPIGWRETSRESSWFLENSVSRNYSLWSLISDLFRFKCLSRKHYGFDQI